MRNLQDFLYRISKQSVLQKRKSKMDKWSVAIRYSQQM